MAVVGTKRTCGRTLSQGPLLNLGYVGCVVRAKTGEDDDVASIATNRVGGIASDSILANQSFDAQQGLPGVKIRRWQIWTG